MRHLHVVAARRPSTPDEMDDAKHDALMKLGRVVALMLLLVVVLLGTVGVLSLEPVETTVQVQR